MRRRTPSPPRPAALETAQPNLLRPRRVTSSRPPALARQRNDVAAVGSETLGLRAEIQPPAGLAVVEADERHARVLANEVREGADVSWIVNGQAPLGDHERLA